MTFMGVLQEKRPAELKDCFSECEPVDLWRPCTAKQSEHYLNRAQYMRSFHALVRRQIFLQFDITAMTTKSGPDYHTRFTMCYSFSPLLKV